MRFLGVFFVMLYLVALLRPVAPLVDYAINKDYIAQFLCINKDKPEMKCDGKCHLKKELKKAAAPVDEELPAIDMKEYPIGFVCLYEEQQRFFDLEQKTSFYRDRLTLGSIQTLFRPPCA